MKGYQRNELKEKVCRINIVGMSEKDNYELQGDILFKLGFSKTESKYPSDTYVGSHRLNGWINSKKRKIICI